MNNTYSTTYNTEEIAETLYDLSTDMDVADYADTADKEISEIENALSHIKCIAENPYNADYFRTFWNCLQTITDIHYCTIKVKF